MGIIEHLGGGLVTRADRRRLDQIRNTTIIKHYQKYPAGSALIEVGNTKVVCAATVEDRVPFFLKGTGTGWVTAEYSLLPSSTPERVQRETHGRVQGRSQEIQRLIGRSLRSVVDLNAIGERTITIDCDVIQADGGTRTASITGAFVALVEACETFYDKGTVFPVKDFVAAISVGISSTGDKMLDLCYEEDSTAIADCNVVMSGSGEFIEIQTTGEKRPFSRAELDEMLTLAEGGIDELISLQKDALGGQLVWRVGRVG
ncbi:MAG: ribonuclease PH [Selenomonadaceae bacterium]|nr:ribonuclease PH [Selenomonadaceae bacterium]